MTDRAKPKANRTPRKGKAPEPKVITITIPDVADPVEFRKYLEGNFPDWAALRTGDKDKLVELMMANRTRGEPVKCKLHRQMSGEWAVEIAGTSEVLSTLKLMQTFNAADIDTVNARSADLVKYLDSVGACNDGKYNAALAFVESMAPTDQAQSMLLVQAYTTHDAAVRALSQIGASDWADHARMYGNLANKLLRTFQGQMDTLMRMQRGNEQVIKHVYVDNRGGQAVFAENVTPRGGNRKGDQQPHATHAIGGGASLLGSDSFGNGVPIPGGVGQEAVSDARWHQPRSANGQGERELSARRADEGGDGPAA